MKTHAEIKGRLLDRPRLASEYDALQNLSCSRSWLPCASRQLTQEDIAARMKTAKSNISRLERSSNPGWKTLNAYAEACGFRLRLVSERR